MKTQKLVDLFDKFENSQLSQKSMHLTCGGATGDTFCTRNNVRTADDCDVSTNDTIRIDVPPIPPPRDTTVAVGI